MKTRVAIVDDHTLFSMALGRLLESDCEIVGVYTEVRPFLDDARQLHPDIVVLDVLMPSMSGLDAAREIRQLIPKTRIIFLTANEDPAVATAAFGVGASAYLLKRSAGSELPFAIRKVLSNQRYITPLLTSELTTAPPTPDPNAAKPVRQLTSRQREVLQLVASGRSMKEAAAILNVSVRTVAFHKYRMMRHLHLKSTAALIQFAVREGLV
jgi:DNA-binding NarL/FixJ family response regulator